MADGFPRISASWARPRASRDRTVPTIAISLDIPVGTVRSRLARGRAQLAEILGNLPAMRERQTGD